MALVRRNGVFYIYFYPFNRDKKIGVRLPKGTDQVAGKRIEAALLIACRSGDYRHLDPVAREVAVRMFHN